MFLFLCSFYIAFWGCLDLFYLRFIKNFQIIWEEFPFFFTVFHNAFDLLGCGYSTEPGRQAHTGSGGLRYAAKILYEIMLAGFLCLTKPAFMRRPWRITPCPAVLGWAFLCFVGIISTVSRQLRYALTREHTPPLHTETRDLRPLRCGKIVACVHRSSPGAYASCL